MSIDRLLSLQLTFSTGLLDESTRWLHLRDAVVFLSHNKHSSFIVITSSPRDIERRDYAVNANVSRRDVSELKRVGDRDIDAHECNRQCCAGD